MDDADKMPSPRYIALPSLTGFATVSEDEATRSVNSGSDNLIDTRLARLHRAFRGSAGLFFQRESEARSKGERFRPD